MDAKHLATMIAIPMFVLAACGAPPEESEEPDPDTRISSREAAESATGDDMDPPSAPRVGALRAELEAQGGTDVTGTVTLTPAAAGAALRVEIHGANSGLPYVAELVGGSCTSPAAVIAVLGQLTAGEAGDGRFQDVLDAELLEGGGSPRIVRVRGAGDPTAIVACGNLGPESATSGTGR